MTSDTTESLGGRETPTVKQVLKWLAMVMVLTVVAMLAVGLALPREWEVERSVEITGDVAQIHALVDDVERWDEWMFDPAEAGEGPEFSLEAVGQGPGAHVAWVSDGSKGRIELLESDPAAGIRWEGRIETDEVNNHGQIRYEELGDGVVRVTLTDTGTLPPVFGGYFVPIMNAALGNHFGGALERLEAAVERAS